MNLFGIAGVALLISLSVTPITIWLARRFNILDYPTRPHPAILHDKPIPRAGGIPPLIGIIITYSMFAPFDKHVLGIFIAAIIIVVVGILDDKFDINPYVRLLTNFFAVGIVIAAGVGITWLTNPFDGQIRLDEIVLTFSFPNHFPIGLLAGPHSIILLADLFAFIWIVWVMNAINWSSGVDGQLPGIAAISTIILGLVANRYLISDPSQIPVATLAFATAGAYIGFLPFSFYPQKIMPGYGGAALAGFLLASLSILAGGKLATAALVIAVPLVDGAWAIIRRIISRKSPVWGDKAHFHHQLLKFGWTKPQIAVFYWFIAAVFGSLALNLESKGKFFAIVMIIVIILAALVTIAYFIKRSEDQRKLT